MANEQNLVRNDQRTPRERRENAKKAGVASGKARRAKKSREERIRYIFDLAVQNPKILKNLEALGIEATQMDNETAADARMMLKALQGDVNAYRTLKSEAYGPQVVKTENINKNIEMKPLVDLTKRKKNGSDNSPKQN